MRLLPLALVVVVAAGPGRRVGNVKIDGYFVRPGSPKPTMKVKKGTVVRWNWTGSMSTTASAEGCPSVESALKRSRYRTKKIS